MQTEPRFIITVRNYGNRYEKPWAVFVKDTVSFMHSGWTFCDTEEQAVDFARSLLAVFNTMSEITAEFDQRN